MAELNKYQPDDLNDAISDLGTLQDVSVERILIGQKFVESDIVKVKMENGDNDPCLAFRFGFDVFLHDGHHRAVALLWNDHKTIPCIVLDMNKYFDFNHIDIKSLADKLLCR